MVEATGGAGLQTSLGKFKWIGNFTQANNVTVTWYESGVKTLADAKTRDVLMGLNLPDFNLRLGTGTAQRVEGRYECKMQSAECKV